MASNAAVPGRRNRPAPVQHYIAQMYLRAWLDPREVAKDRHVLWVYKQHLQPKRKGTKAVGAAVGFYVSETPGAENTTEPVLAKIESAAVKHLTKLRTGNINLTAQERAEFSTFLALTALRTKVAREHIDSVIIERFRQGVARMLRESEVPAEAEELAANIASGKTQLIQESKGWSIKTAFEQVLNLDKLLWRCPWGLLKAPDGESFITSDNPLLLYNQPALASGLKGFENTTVQPFVFPISPRFLLMGDVTCRGDGQANISPDKVADFNVRQVDGAHEEVYASLHCDELQELLDETFAKRAPTS